MEVSIACVMLIAGGAIVAQMLHLIARQERSTDARQAAIRAVANRLEVLQASDWDELEIRPATEETVPANVLAVMKTATMHSEVTAVEDGAARQIRVWIEWRDATGKQVQSLELSAWKHRPQAEEQP